MGNETSGMGRTGDPRLDLLLNLAQMEAQLRGVGVADDAAQAHAWDPRDCSDNLRVSADHSEVTRGGGSMGSGLLTLVGQTDMVRGKKGYLDGIHMWEIYWPRNERGSHAVIGVATEAAPIKCVGYKSLIGSDDQSLGWDITHNAALYNSVVFSKYPDTAGDDFKAPDTVLVILNLTEGTLSFKDPKTGKNYGLCLSGLGLFKRSGKRLYPAVSMTKNGGSVKIKYLGDSQSRAAILPTTTSTPALKPIVFPSGNYTFHTNKGGNIALSNRNKTATRNNGLDEGVVLTSSPLRPNTLFEVRLDKKQGDHPLLRFSNSIEIGVTANNPATLRLPDTMTDLKFGKSWMISGSKLAFNGREIQSFSKIDLNSFEQGTLLGMAITPQRQLQIFIDGELKAKCNLDIPQTVYGVVDVYGKAEQVTIIDRSSSDSSQQTPEAQTGKSKADVVMDGLKLVIQKMNEKKTNGVVEVARLLTDKVNVVYIELGEASHQTLLVDKFSEMGGAEAVAGYAEFLIKRGRETEDVNQCFIILMTTLLNTSHASLQFASKLGKTSLFKTMITDIKKFLPRYQSSENLAKRLVYWLAVLHNCSKSSENRDPLRKVDSATVLKETLSRDNDIGIQLLALAGLVNVLFEYETKQLRIKESLLDKLVHHLCDAVEKPEGNINSVIHFAPAGESFNFYALELTVCIQAVAYNSYAGNYLVKRGVCDGLFKQLDKGNRNDREIALGALWQLATPQTVARIMQLPNLMGKLRQLKERGEEEVEQAATRLQVRLNELASKRDQPSGGQRMPKEQPTDCTYRKYCMNFINSMDLADAFLERNFSTCFCASCHAKKGDDLYYNRGTPPQTYGLPIGWFRLGLKAPPKAAAHKAFDNWHRCYHGTKVDLVKRILEVGDILIPGDIALGGVKLGEREGHFCEGYKPDGFDTKQIFVSPSIRYAGLNAYATPQKYEDKESKKVFTGRVAFQILIRPNSYAIGKETVGAKDQIDPKFSNQELEWSTKERGAVIFYGLLVKLDEDRTKASVRASIFSGSGATGN